MPKGCNRYVIIGGLILTSLAIIFVILRSGILTRRAEQGMVLPVDLKQVIPESWAVVSGKTGPCDFDNDGEDEWLLIYRYDATSVSAPSAAAPGMVGRSLIGGAIYDAQVNRPAQAPGNQSPYRPALLIPYRLLPDIFGGKGQGYLGESDVVVLQYPRPERNRPCQARELAILGYSDSGPSGGFPTRLSVFRWGGEDVGYLAAHFVGNARIEVSDISRPIIDVTTYNRLNDRSALCAAQEYRRTGPTGQEYLPPDLQFNPEEASYTIDFCFGYPDDPAYPEGVVIALLRGHNPSNAGSRATPTGGSFLSDQVSLPTELATLRDSNRQPYRITALSNTGSIAPYPAPGRRVEVPPSSPATSEPEVWWWGEERAQVVTDIIINGTPRSVLWSLSTLASERRNADVHWRIVDVEVR